MSSDRTQVIGGDSTALLSAQADCSSAESCPHCSTGIPAGQEFCPNCGYQRGSWQLAPSAPVQPPAEAPLGRFLLRAADGRSFGLADGETVVGRGEVALRIDDGYISRQHARFTVSADEVSLCDLGSSNGSFVGGERLAPNEPRVIQPGGSFSLGQLELTLQVNPAWSDATVMLDSAEDDPNAAPSSNAAATDTESAVQSGWSLRSAEGNVIPLPLGDSTCGRREGNTIVIPDGFISGLHCNFSATPDSLSVSDQGSTNGSFVNGVQLAPQEPTALAAGDLLRLGQLEYTVELAETAEPSENHDADPDGAQTVDE